MFFYEQIKCLYSFDVETDRNQPGRGHTNRQTTPCTNNYPISSRFSSLWTLNSDEFIQTMRLNKRQPSYEVLLNVLGIFVAGHWFRITTFPFCLLSADLFNS